LLDIFHILSYRTKNAIDISKLLNSWENRVSIKKHHDIIIAGTLKKNLIQRSSSKISFGDSDNP